MAAQKQLGAAQWEPSTEGHEMDRNVALDYILVHILLDLKNHNILVLSCQAKPSSQYIM